ncbi:oxidoreductase [Histoplasma capsulatum G186AR]|uniref:Oxidoreductase n=1 Tax=Ajellomyces capsulatus TaxID=5037 RepID=A0A8H7Z7E6_AJECA|nr:oxidoreductase [Histoplasma capsulatum]QSS69115.1 oxidoreductase [Histoplasma capsulatum G186AR]
MFERFQNYMKTWLAPLSQDEPGNVKIFVPNLHRTIAYNRNHKIHSPYLLLANIYIQKFSSSFTKIKIWSPPFSQGANSASRVNWILSPWAAECWDSLWKKRWPKLEQTVRRTALVKRLSGISHIFPISIDKRKPFGSRI